MHSFKLIIEKERSELVLASDGVEKARREWQESRDMGRQLFTAIAELLKENGLKAGEIADFEIRTDVSDDFTPLDGKEDSFWSKPRQSPPFDNPENLPLLSDLTGLTSVKIAETVKAVYTWSVRVLSSKN